MKNRFVPTFGSLFLCMMLLFNNLGGVNAQAASSVGVISLAELGATEIYLTGPHSSSTLTFGLPAHWNITPGTQINLNGLSVFSVSEGDSAIAYGGTLTVKFNRDTIAILPINTIGEFNLQIPVAASNMISPRADGRMELRFELDSAISCRINQHTDVVIDPTSTISFSYEEKVPETALVNFPRPIYQDSIFPDNTLIVVPDQAAGSELQSAVTIAAGLGNLTSGGVNLGLTTLGQLSAEQQSDNDLIFVGKASSLPLLPDLGITGVAADGNLSLSGDPDDGFIQMLGSPWSKQNVVLVVSGNTDAGVIKAAQAISTGVLNANNSPDLAIVQSVQEATIPVPLTFEQTLGDLGYDQFIFDVRGVDSTEFNFYLPPGNILTNDAVLELAYGHSALVDYDLSGLVVLLNDQPIGSVRFTHETSQEAINIARVTLPSAATLPGYNRLEIRSSLEPMDTCTDPELKGLWATIWPESRLYLPISPIEVSTVAALDLSVYPAPMVFDPTLSSTAFVVERGGLNAWQAAIQVASYLGDQSNGAIAQPTVIFDDLYSEADLSAYNLIVIGRPSQLSIMDELNPILPIPFEGGTDQTQGNYAQVTYRIPLDVPLGYVEFMPSPWNSSNVVVAALGNTTQGVGWGAAALSDSPLGGQLAGNFAVINDTRVQTTDTRLGVSVATAPAIEPLEPVLPTAQPNLPTPTASRPTWILVAIQVFVGLIVLVLIFVLWSGWRRSRPG